MHIKIKEIHDMIHQRFGVTPTPHLTHSTDKIQPQSSLRQYCRYCCLEYLGWSIERIASHGRTTPNNVRQNIRKAKQMIENPRWDHPIEGLISQMDKEIRSRLEIIKTE